MAGRPPKQTVDYFPHYANASMRKTVDILERKYGNDGYAFWFKLLELLARTPGHYYTFPNEEELFALAALTRAEIDDTKTILGMLARLGAIDADLLSVNCIWATNLVGNLSYIYDKRSGDPPAKPTQKDIIEQYKQQGIVVLSGTDIPISDPAIAITGEESTENGYFRDFPSAMNKGNLSTNKESNEVSLASSLSEKYRYRSDGRQPLTQTDIDNNPSGKWRCVGFNDKLQWDFVCVVKDLKGKCGDPIVGCVCAEPVGVVT